MKPREKAMPTWLQAVMALTCGFIVAGVITTTIFLIINDRTDTQQTGLIHKAFAQITESQRRGCARGNDFRRQSNARVPLERAEAMVKNCPSGAISIAGPAPDDAPVAEPG